MYEKYTFLKSVNARFCMRTLYLLTVICNNKYVVCNCTCCALMCCLVIRRPILFGEIAWVSHLAFTTVNTGNTCLWSKKALA